MKCFQINQKNNGIVYGDNAITHYTKIISPFNKQIL